MINHTMIVSFDQPLPATELDQYLADIERAMLDTDFVQSVATRRHISIPGEEAIPALIATAIVQVAPGRHRRAGEGVHRARHR
jgi:hypothetical protein